MGTSRSSRQRFHGNAKQWIEKCTGEIPWSSVWFMVIELDKLPPSRGWPFREWYRSWSERSNSSPFIQGSKGARRSCVSRINKKPPWRGDSSCLPLIAWMITWTGKCDWIWLNDGFQIPKRSWDHSLSPTNRWSSSSRPKIIFGRESLVLKHCLPFYTYSPNSLQSL